MRLYEILAEAVSHDYLFHGTSLRQAELILKDNRLGVENSVSMNQVERMPADEEDGGISFSRRFGDSLGYSAPERIGARLVFVFDRTMLKDALGRHLRNFGMEKDEEEAMVNGINNIKKYIVKILVTVTPDTVSIFDKNKSRFPTILSDPRTEIRIMPDLSFEEKLTYSEYLHMSKPTDINDMSAGENNWNRIQQRAIKEVEPAIAYAKNILKGRWPELEDKILSDHNKEMPYHASDYAKDVLKRPWPAAEPAILASNNGNLIYQYIKGTNRGRWPEAEKIIFGSSTSSKEKEEYKKLYIPD